MLEERAQAEERMDAEDLDAVTYAAVVRDLGRVNTLTLARRPTLAFLGGLGRNDFKLLDVGFGDGDMLRAIARAFPKARLSGVDLNPRSLAAARARTPRTIELVTGDYASLAGQGWDVIVSSLVAHHMTRDQLTVFLRFMDAEARLGWFINDLHRHGFAWTGFPLLARLASWHEIVRQDGTLSIARSYRPREWPPLLAEAGIDGATVARVFPFRLCVSKIR